jgi:hypothetical protein
VCHYLLITLVVSVVVETAHVVVPLTIADQGPVPLAVVALTRISYCVAVVRPVAVAVSAVVVAKVVQTFAPVGERW